MEKTLLELVYTELEKRRGRLPDICKACPDIDYSWLSKLNQRRIPNPSVTKIQRLYDHFHGITRERAEV